MLLTLVYGVDCGKRGPRNRRCGHALLTHRRLCLGPFGSARPSDTRRKEIVFSYVLNYCAHRSRHCPNQRLAYPISGLNATCRAAKLRWRISQKASIPPPSYDSAKNSRAYEGLAALMRLQLTSCQNDSRAYKSPRNKISAAAPADPAKRFPRIRKARSRSCSLLRTFAYLTRRSTVTAQRRVTR